MPNSKSWTQLEAIGRRTGQVIRRSQMELCQTEAKDDDPVEPESGSDKVARKETPPLRAHVASLR
jgi:hypothetical protein